MRCPNCGATYKASESQCPYCNSFNYQGAKQQYMEQLEEIRSDMEDLDTVPMETYRSEVKRHLSFAKRVLLGILSVVFLLIVCGIGCALAEEAMWKRDSQAVLRWYDEHVEQLDQWYEEGDLQSLSDFHQSLEAEEYSAFYIWDHADVIVAYEAQQYIAAVHADLTQGKEVSDGQLSGAMYDSFSLIFFPGDFSDEEEEQLALWQETAWTLLTEGLGFSRESAQVFYEENSEYDILSYEACEDYVDKMR